MSLVTSEMTPADIAAVTNNGNNGMWGGDNAWWIIILFLFAFVGNGGWVSVMAGQTITLPVKYSVNGVLTDITDMEQVNFSVSPANLGSFASEHSNVFTASTGTGSGHATVTVTNSATNVTYQDTIQIVISVGP